MSVSPRRRRSAIALYLVIAVGALVLVVTGHWPFAFAVVVVGTLAAVMSSLGAAASERDDRIPAIRLDGQAVFPLLGLTVESAGLGPAVAASLSEAAQARGGIAAVPGAGGAPSPYGTECAVELAAAGFELRGLRRIQLTDGIEALGQDGPGAGRCAFHVMEDTNRAAAEELMQPVGELARALGAQLPAGVRMLADPTAVTDPSLVASVIAQAVAGRDVRLAAALLADNDVASRLRQLQEFMTRRLPARRAEAASRPAGGAGGPDDRIAVEPPDGLPKLASLGGMDDVKRRIRETIGVLRERPDLAERLDVTFNGVLFHGPPGTGKTALARATAGEYGLSFIHLTGGDLTDKYMGESEKRVRAAFEAAAASAPCLLFFDEFDSIAGRRGDGGNAQFQAQVVGQLLRSLEAIRKSPGAIVAAATNDVDALDPAVVRPGRFDLRIFVGMPDAEARRAILAARLSSLPTEGDLALDEVVAETEGKSAAFLTALVDDAKIRALKRAVAAGGADAAIRPPDLEEALAARSGLDRSGAPLRKVGWDDLVLPEEAKQQLKSLVAVLANPQAGRELGLKRPSGALLYGPPGTGKTTVARVIASELGPRVSFLAATGSDLVSKWVGDSAKNVRDLFNRAREASPSVIFIDEIDALLPRRDADEGGSPETRSVVTEFLQQLDGIGSSPGVFVLGATNLPQRLDPAVTRGGRLGRSIEIPQPTTKGREELFRLHTRPIALDPTVDLSRLADATTGLSGADIEALCGEAVENAFQRGSDPRAVTAADFDAVLPRFLRRP